MSLLFGVVSKKSALFKVTKILSYIFFWNFIILAIIWSVILYWGLSDNFCILWSNFTFLHPIPVLICSKAIVGLLNCACTFVKKQIALNVRFISGLSIPFYWFVWKFSHQYYTVLTTVTFIVHLILSGMSSTFVLFKNVLTILVPLHFHKLWDQFVNICVGLLGFW